MGAFWVEIPFSKWKNQNHSRDEWKFTILHVDDFAFWRFDVSASRWSIFWVAQSVFFGSYTLEFYTRWFIPEKPAQLFLIIHPGIFRPILISSYIYIHTIYVYIYMYYIHRKKYKQSWMLQSGRIRLHFFCCIFGPWFIYFMKCHEMIRELSCWMDCWPVAQPCGG